MSSFVDREVKQISDPTFLLPYSSWKELANYPNIKTPYILYFALHIENGILDYCKKLSIESGLPLYVMNQTQPAPIDNSYLAVKDAGPRDFIGYIANADMVITDSFHCTAFSIIMSSKNFYTYISSGNKRGSRIDDLLESFGLLSHKLTSADLSYAALSANTINHDSINDTINKDRLEACDFLTKSINA